MISPKIQQVITAIEALGGSRCRWGVASPERANPYRTSEEEWLEHTWDDCFSGDHNDLVAGMLTMEAGPSG